MENMKYVIKELYHHLWRTILSILGYAIAIFFILIVICITSTNKNNSLGILQGTGTHFIVYIPTSMSCCVNENARGSVYAEGVNTQMLNHEMIYTIKGIEGIKDAAPYILYKTYNAKYKTDISIGGIDTTSVATISNVCAASNLIKGKYLSDKLNEIVAEESFAIAHKLSVGDSLEIFGGKLILAGIINSGIRPAKADFYAPIEHVRTILRDRLQCKAEQFDMNIILVEVADARHQVRVIEQIKKLMYKFSVSSYNCYEPASKVMQFIEKTSSILTILIFLFLIVFSIKTQTAALMERFREIGILKSLGWSDFKLSTHVITISLIHSFIGFSIGLLLGILTVMLINSLNLKFLNLIEFEFQYSSIPILFILSITGGIIAGIFPIIKIYRTKAGDIINKHM